MESKVKSKLVHSRTIKVLGGASELEFSAVFYSNALMFIFTDCDSMGGIIEVS